MIDELAINMEQMKCDICGMTFDSKEKLMEHAQHAHGMGQMKKMESGNYLTKVPLVGAFSGAILGGIAMALILVIGGVMMIHNAGGMFMVIGMSLGAGMTVATGTGVALHFVVAIVAGLIFGTAVYVIKPFRKISTSRSLGLGALFGIIVYLVFWVPMTLAILGPTMVKLLGPSAMGMLGTVLALAFVGHLLYGLILGYLTFIIGRTKTAHPRGTTA